MSAVEGPLDRAVDGHGAVVGVVGPPGIGNSRLVREVAAIAGRRDVEVFTTFCESHTSQVPFHVVAGLLLAAIGVEDLDGQSETPALFIIEDAHWIDDISDAMLADVMTVRELCHAVDDKRSLAIAMAGLASS
jgi:predicted ATPase